MIYNRNLTVAAEVTVAGQCVRASDLHPYEVGHNAHDVMHKEQEYVAKRATISPTFATLELLKLDRH